MSDFRLINPVEIRFFHWLNNPSESYHAYDRGRFYDFVDAVLHYRKTAGRKWLDKQFFVSQCKKHKPVLSDELVTLYWKRFEVIRDYYEFRRPEPFKTIHRYNDDVSGRYIQMVIDGEIETISVGKEVFEKKYISKKLFLELLKESRGQNLLCGTTMAN